MAYSKEDIIQFFKESIAKEMKLDTKDMDIHAEFFIYGLDSISSIYILDKLEDYLGITLNPIDFYDYPTIEKFSTYLIDQKLKP